LPALSVAEVFIVNCSLLIAIYQNPIQEYRDRYIEGLLNGEDSRTVDVWKKTYSRLQWNFNHLCAPSVDKRWGNPDAKLY